MAMAPRGPRLTLLLPLILLAATLAQLSEGASYRQFVRQHVDHPKTRAPNDRIYCNLLMQRRGLTRPQCKPTNTFIHTSTHQLRNICGRGGRPVSGNLRDSIRSFSVTTCRVLPGSQPGRCRYRAATGVTRVRVACVRRLPVHLEPTYLP
ncbi:ribonuclease-like [Mauremys reevesii]|uniref:ribonuclease-like n=1 Tax=Mauremys reevesii TaxID=260615 RepID=UPI00193F4EBC|nr:ribonuclease-like [Mauremys reevesii]XP_039353205.1 ribonuclease-like [Mauremys reevesii]XP_039353206.1 ribonuclease-like [Mauremys reevesii]